MNTAYCTIDEAWGDLINKDNKDAKKRRKKPPTDPICELYESKANSSYNDVDLVRYANEVYEKPDKSRYQRSMRPLPLTYEEEENVSRQPQPALTNVKENIKRYNSTRPESTTLFEKQFEIKLPALYDGGSCSVTQEDSVEPEHDWAVEEEDFDTYQSYQIPKARPVRRHPRKESFQTKQERFIFPDEENMYTDNENTMGYNNLQKRYANIQMLDIILYIISGIILIFLMDQFVKIGMSLQS